MTGVVSMMRVAFSRYCCSEQGRSRHSSSRLQRSILAPCGFGHLWLLRDEPPVLPPPWEPAECSQLPGLAVLPLPW